MPRPNNFWDVLSQTADYASEAIPAAQEKNRQIAQERERFGLRAQQEQDQMNETRRYHDEMTGLRRSELDFQRQKAAHPAEHPNFENLLAAMAANPQNFDPADIKRVHEAASEYFNMKRPEPQPKEWQQPPNFIGDIRRRAGTLLSQNAGIRQKEGTTTIIPGQNGQPPTYAPPTTPALTEEAATEKAYGEVSGRFPQFNVKPDSIRTGLGLRSNVSRTGAPSSNIGDLRRMDRQQPIDISTLSDEELDALERQVSGQ